MGFGDLRIELTDSLFEIVNDKLLIAFLQLVVDDSDIVHASCEEQIDHLNHLSFTRIVKFILNDLLHYLIVD